MLATIRDDTWKVLNMQHIYPNSKRRDYSDIPVGGQKKKKNKGPAHMVEGGHHFTRKSPQSSKPSDCVIKQVYKKVLASNSLGNVSLICLSNRTILLAFYQRNHAWRAYWYDPSL